MYLPQEKEIAVHDALSGSLEAKLTCSLAVISLHGLFWRPLRIFQRYKELKCVGKRIDIHFFITL